MSHAPLSVPSRGRRLATPMRGALRLLAILTVALGAAGAAASPASAGSITGKLTGAGTGTPIQGAWVHVQTASGTWVNAVQTNASGTYTASDLNAGDYVLQFMPPSAPKHQGGYISTYSGGHDSAALATRITVGSGTAEFNQALQPGTFVAGRLTAAGNAPLAGASVQLTSTGSPSTYEATTSDVNGDWSIGNLRPGAGYRIQFGRTGYAGEYYDNASSYSSATTVYPPAGGQFGIDARLEEEATVAGTVRDAGGAAIAAAMVYLVTPGGDQLQSAQTDAQGKYLLRGALPGTYRVRVTAPLGSSYQPATSTEFTLAAGDDRTGVDLQLRRAPRISGTVKFRNGTPAANLSVAVYRVGDNSSAYWATTKADGTYEVLNVAPGKYHVSFSGTGLDLSYYPGVATREQATEIVVDEEADATGIDATPSAPGTVAVTLTTPEGTPAGGIPVELRPVAGNQAARTFQTAADGKVTATVPAGEWYVRYATPGFSWLPPHAYLPRYHPNARFAADATLLTIEDGEAHAPLTAQLVRGATVRGTVTAAGAPQADADVQLLQRHGSATTSRLVTTDDEGRYEITGVEAGTHVVAARPHNSAAWTYAPGSSDKLEAAPITVAAGALSQGNDVALPVHGRVTGVVSAAGEGAISGSVAAFPWRADGVLAWSAVGTTWLESDGRYTLPLPAGRYLLRFQGSRGGRPFVTTFNGGTAHADEAPAVVVRAGMPTTADVSLLAGSSIAGTIRGADGQPLAGAGVTVSFGESSSYVTTGDDGTYRIAGLAAQRYTVSASHPRHARRVRAGAVALGPDQHVNGIDLQLDARPVVSGKITLTGGTPVNGAYVQARPIQSSSTGGYAPGTSTDEHGEYELALDPGYYVIVASDGDEQLREVYYDGATGSSERARAAVVELRNGDARVIDLAGEAGGNLRGRGRSAFNSGISGKATLYRNGRVVRSTSTAWDGGYEFRNLAPGDYVVGVTGSGYVRRFTGDATTLEQATAITVAAGADTNAPDLVLPMVTSGSGGTPVTGGIRGAVKTSDGSDPGLVGVRVVAEDGSASYYLTTFDAGSFASTLRDGRYRLNTTGNDEYESTWYPAAATEQQGQLVTVAGGKFTTGITITIKPKLAISGRVLDGDEPLAGARVYVHAEGQEAEFWGMPAVTGESGRFRLPVTPGRYTVSAAAPDGTPLARTWLGDVTKSGDAAKVTVTPSAGSDGHVIRMRPGGTIRGRATGPGGTPLARAQVQAIAADQGEFDWIPDVTTYTRSDGTYTLRGLPPTGWVVRFSPPADRPELGARFAGNTAASRDAQRFAVRDGQTIEGVDAQLGSGTTVGGVVRHDGDPVEGIEVVATDRDGYEVSSTRTGPDGRYEFSGLAPRGLFVEAVDSLGRYLHTARSVASAATPEAVDLQLQRAAEIRGTVTLEDGVSIAAIADYGSYYGESPNVVVYDTAGRYVTMAYIDKESGSYRIGGLRAGTYTVEFEAAGAVTETFDGVTGDGQGTPITVAAGQVRGGVDAELTLGGGVAGYVRGPASRATVIVRDASGQVVGQTTASPNTSYPYYELRGLPAGDLTVQFVPHDGDAVSQYYRGAARRDEATAVRVVAGELTSGIDGVLATADAATTGVIAGVVSDVRRPDRGLDWASVRLYRGTELVAQTETDVDGSYRFAGLPPAGDYKLSFGNGAGWIGEFHENAATLAAAKPVAVTAGGTTAVDAQLTGRPGRVRGTVRSGGVALAGATVTIYDEDDEPVSSVATAADGSYSAELPTGDYRLAVSKPGYGHHWWRAASSLDEARWLWLGGGEDREQVDFDVVPAATLGRVNGTVRSGSDPVSGATVSLLDADGDAVARVTSTADGSWQADVPAGDYRVLASHEDYERAALPGTIAVTAGGTRDGVAVALTRGQPAEIRGTVRGPSGPLAGATVTLRGGGGGGVVAGPVNTGADGTYAFTVAPGSYRIAVTRAGYLDAYWPSATTLAGAQLVTVAAGEQLGGRDLTLTAKPADPQPENPGDPGDPGTPAGPGTPGGGDGGGGGTPPPAGGGGAPQGGGVQSAPPVIAPVPQLPAGAKSVTVAGNGALELEIGCRAGSTCRGQVSVTFQPPTPKRKKGGKKPKKPKPVTVVKAVSVSGGPVTLKLTAKGKKLLAAAGKKGMKVTLLITGPDGKTTQTVVTLKAAPAKKKTKKK